MRKTNNTFYVSVEGDSELKYLKRLKQLINVGDYTSKVDFVAKIDKPISFVKSKNNGFIEYPFYHICDYEGNQPADIKKFTGIIDDIKEARNLTKVGYNLSYTNLCFELWLILHKSKFTRKLTNKDEYKNEINKNFFCIQLVYMCFCYSLESLLHIELP